MIRRVVSHVGAWLKQQIEAQDPVQCYLAASVDLVDLEHRMRALQRNEVRHSSLCARRF
jgi:hypothetical protein